MREAGGPGAFSNVRAELNARVLGAHDHLQRRERQPVGALGLLEYVEWTLGSASFTPLLAMVANLQ